MSASPRGRLASSARPGFTLFEVSISLLIISVTVVSVLVVFPAGLRQLQNNRYKAYSSALACHLIDGFAQPFVFDRHGDVEGPTPWDVGSDYRPTAPDLEMHLSNMRFGLMPMPTNIARRIDSDNDEIQRMLDEGGNIYYLPPSTPSGWAENMMPASPPSDMKNIVIGVVGNAQHNASQFLPYKRWPYYASVPLAPLAFTHANDFSSSYGGKGTGSIVNKFTGKYVKATKSGSTYTYAEDEAKFSCYFNFDSVNYYTFAWQALFDPEIKYVFNWAAAYYEMQGPNPATLANDAKGLPGTPNPSDQDSIRWLVIKHNLANFICSAQKYLVTTGVTSADMALLLSRNQNGNGLERLLGSSALGLPIKSASPATMAMDTAKVARRILAVNYLASALMSMTRWYNKSQMDGAATVYSLLGNPSLSTVDSSLNGYLVVDSTAWNGRSTHDELVALVENCRFLYYYFCAAHPYNWAVPRPYEHATMMDYPLIEKDLFPQNTMTKPLDALPNALFYSGSLAGFPTQASRQWRYMTPQMFTTTSTDASSLSGRGPGASASYPQLCYQAGDQSYWEKWFSSEYASGKVPDRFSLLRRFQASERCRQLVFWAVDWQQYEDFETSPAAPMDASRYLKFAPETASPAWSNIFPDARTTLYSLQWRIHPEYSLFYGIPVDGYATGSPMTFDFQALGDNNVNQQNAIQAQQKATRIVGSAVVMQGAGVPQSNVTTNDPYRGGAPTWWNSAVTNGTPVSVMNADLQSGVWGADRNANKQLDRGPLRASVRLRAQTVARFNFYDPRVPASLR